ncbi:MAG TPA: MarR family transcriptional regulator [Solirubrobacteraceae bacterium]|nr:MarR family transcriptional regulator [Solirubrobacteraceae bacterium]
MAAPDQYPVEDYLCLALNRTARAAVSAYRPWLAELGLTYPQYLVMRLLWQRGSLPVGEIGGVLGLDYGTLSPLLKRLDGAGLLSRRRRIDDERAVDVALTDAGRALEARAAEIPERFACALGLSMAEARQLRVLLDRVAVSLVESGGSASA